MFLFPLCKAQENNVPISIEMKCVVYESMFLFPGGKAKKQNKTKQKP